MNTYERPDGATVMIWEVECGDCGFVTGIACVEWPNGEGRYLTGAGCHSKPRRNLSVAKKWADNVERPTGGGDG